MLRGLKERNAVSQLFRFRAFCRSTEILPIDDTLLELASDLWAAGGKQGLVPNDADLIIAATSIRSGRTLVTGNTAHFAWIRGLTLANWRDP